MVPALEAFARAREQWQAEIDGDAAGNYGLAHHLALSERLADLEVREARLHAREQALRHQMLVHRHDSGGGGWSSPRTPRPAPLSLAGGGVPAARSGSGGSGRTGSSSGIPYGTLQDPHMFPSLGAVAKSPRHATGAGGSGRSAHTSPAKHATVRRHHSAHVDTPSPGLSLSSSSSFSSLGSRSSADGGGSTARAGPDALAYDFETVLSLDAAADDAAAAPFTPIAAWTEADVQAWVSVLPVDLARYEPVFAENNITGDILMQLTDEQLRDALGIASFGHRTQLLAFVRQASEYGQDLAAYPPLIPVRVYVHRNHVLAGILCAVDGACGSKHAWCAS